jgi:ferric-dicitrate binding protein FerR (iron transport regulator)
MTRNDLEDLLDRYLKGTASAAETERVEAWLNDVGNPEAEWFKLDQHTKDKWLASVFGQIRESIGAHEHTHTQHTGTVLAADTQKSKWVIMHSRKHLWRGVAAAAAVLILFFIIRMEWPVWQSRLHPVQLSALTVPLHQRQQITLADGSKILVNERSELRYPKEFNGNTREVYLSGEAYFDVQHDVSRPFIIHTGKVVTTVLGTAFNIKADRAGNTVVVTVTNGKVSVADGSRLLDIITPNEQISFNLSNDRWSKQAVDAQQAVAWQEDEDLHFEDITLAEAAKKLEQRFHVKIDFSNSRIANCRFTGTALAAEGLDKILKVVCAFNNASYRTKADGSILIDGPGCN